ncbi:tRNA (adenosine(37)-N6)-dimethylallyltransferase MiaA [Egibacter rhizosphaerae]|uniref:tRNA dimethylallyltransferase n=1 Tax=Egibacter rhizosphaerae TaxID=1670831 RepID=A0A411YJB1_9ACTN|nr:tRNA (adenosine(37)-N6)-dimethylallyltransferase MiaA [Egibacter rhizosphaerae]QBI21287.1 tRNA (adenosine(37)-N6)-dimethylallyltransferase MiaA [Egibacter rhizosphaerae]
MLALVGPTAAGKSEAALSAARELDRTGIPVEIVAVDAFTVYRGMDVGTAKSPAEARAEVAHHMVDVLAPEEDCTVQWFQGQARQRIAEVRARGALPLLVGGSGLYFRAVVDPLEFPPTDPDVRDALVARHATDPEGAHEQLARLDPAAAARIEPGNLRRTVRALEVIRLTGRPFSAFRTAWDLPHEPRSDLHVVGIDMDRATLAERIERRVARMLAGGLVEECRALAGRSLSRTARQAIGYAEVFDYLAGQASLEEAAERVRVRTRRFAARQQRWFRADPRVQWRSDRVAAALVGAAKERLPNR